MKPIKNKLRCQEMDMYLIRNNKGFTLVETIVVLFIISFMGVIGVKLSTVMSVTLQSDLYSHAIKEKLLYAQHYAVVHGVDTTVSIDSEQRIVQSSITNDEVIHIPQAIQTHSKLYQFSEFTGHLKVYSHYHFETSYHQYVLKVQFGRGQIYVEKIKK